MSELFEPARGGGAAAETAVTPLGERARYEDFLRAAADWVWETDENLNYTVLSRGIARVFGVPSTALVGSYIFALSYYRTVDPALMQTVEAIEDRIPFRDRRLQIRDARGLSRSLRLSGVPVFDEASGRFLGYRGVGREVPAEQEVEQELAGLRHVLADFSELTSAWTWQADSECRLTQVSRDYREHAGLSEEESLGAAFAKLWRLGAATAGAVRRRQSFAHQYSRWVHGALGEERTFVVAGRPVLGEGGAFLGYRGIGADVSEEFRSAAGSLATARDEAERASQAKSVFLTNLSHEMRTPLNAIIGFSDAIRNEVFGALRSKKYRQYVEDIHASAGHLLGIVDDLLDIARVETGKMRLEEAAIDVADLVAGCRRMLEGAFEAGELELAVEVAEDLPALRADPVKLRQILLNLLTNAIKFTPAGGTVTLRAGLDDTGGFECEVRDNGVGLDPEDIPKALSRLGQAGGEQGGQVEGLGLGLAISKALVEAHGGTLTLTSEKGRGTRAVVRLPAERLDGEAEGEPWKILF